MLYDHQAAGATDLPDTERAVRTAPRKKHGNGAGASIMGERAEEKVDRQFQACAFDRLGQTQHAVFDKDISIGRNRINAVGLDRRLICRFDNLHRCLPRQNLRHMTDVGRSEVLYHDKSKSGFRTDLVEEFFERIHGAR